MRPSLLLLAVLPAPVLAQTLPCGVVYEDLGSLLDAANAISADGAYVAGIRGLEAYLLGPPGAIALGKHGGHYSEATAVSDDGATVAGFALNTAPSNETRAFRWTAAGSQQDLGVLPGWFDSVATDISGDGAVVVGYSGNEFVSAHPWRWTSAGLVDLGVLPGASFGDALATNTDGSVVVGRSYGSGGAVRAWRWSAATGMVELGPGSATAVSGDGEVVAGVTPDGCVFRWEQASGVAIVDCPELPEVSGIDATGGVILGTSYTPSGSRATRWSEAVGREVLAMPITMGSVDAAGLSADGAIVVGTVYGLQSAPFLWRDRAVPALGESVCASLAVPNSTGCRGRVDAVGSASALANSLRLTGDNLPPGSFGYFLFAAQSGSVFPVPASQGRLCLSGPVSRLRGVGQVQVVDPAGHVELPLDLTSMPTPNGTITIQPGESWTFTLWHRDANPGVTSNFADAVRVRFL